ncbi:MAG: GntR family transcriptional regulator [bacterium]|jgi:GntR family transcriptional regulator
MHEKIPKYFQISQELISKIQTGEFPCGALIPSENEIISTYHVSNTTARRALQEMERQGWVHRIRGKGTFVREGKVRRSASRILSFTKNMLEEGRTPSTKLISIHLLKPTRSITINNRKHILKGPVCEIQRLRFADQVPMMFEKRYISTQLCPKLSQKDLEGSLYEIYEKDYGLHLTEIQQVLSVVDMEAELLEYFDLKMTLPAFRVEGITFCGKDLVLEMEESFYRGDQYQFTVTASR